MDNYEWHENYKPEAKFGIFYIDSKDSNLARKVTTGAEAYKFIIRESTHEATDGTVTDLALLKAEDQFGTFSPDGNNLYGPKICNGKKG